MERRCGQRWSRWRGRRTSGSEQRTTARQDGDDPQSQIDATNLRLTLPRCAASRHPQMCNISPSPDVQHQPYLSGRLRPLCRRRSHPWPGGSTWRISCSCRGCWSVAWAASPHRWVTAAAPHLTAPRWPHRFASSLQEGGRDPSADDKPRGLGAWGGQKGLLRPLKEAEDQIAGGPEQHPQIQVLIQAWKH